MNYPWYNEEVCKQMCASFVKAHPQKNMNLLRDIAAHGNIDEFRTLCNCLYNHMYAPRDFYNMEYGESIELQKLCNERIHTLLGEYDKLYNKFFKIWRSERWSGDETWKLFCDAYKPYEEARAILTLVDLIQYFGQSLSMENLFKINDLYSHGRYWELYVEDMYSFHIEIPSEFKEANARRKAHTLRWRKFMKYIWEGDFKSGKQMLNQYDEEYAAHVEKCRKENS